MYAKKELRDIVELKAKIAKEAYGDWPEGIEDKIQALLSTEMPNAAFREALIGVLSLLLLHRSRLAMTSVQAIELATRAERLATVNVKLVQEVGALLQGRGNTVSQGCMKLSADAIARLISAFEPFSDLGRAIAL